MRDIVDQIPQQKELNANARESAKKLAVDAYLRVVGAEDLIALGDCSKLLEDALPATAQVRGVLGCKVLGFRIPQKTSLHWGIAASYWKTPCQQQLRCGGCLGVSVITSRAVPYHKCHRPRASGMK